MKRRAAGLLAALSLALTSCWTSTTSAASVPLSSLGARGQILCTDQLPNLPAGASTMQASTACDVQNFVLTSAKSPQFAGGAKGDGVADDTAALQAAFDSGLSIYIPPGVYKTSATLNITHAKNDGQLIVGAASYTQVDAYNAATYGNSTIIKPTAAVSVALLIDGTPFGGYQLSWVQNWQLKNVAFDLANMADDASHVAIKEVQAWNITLDHTTVINDGNYKRGWLLIGGAFGTTLNHPWGGIIDMEGVDSTYEVTTILISNPGVTHIYANYTGSVTVVGGAVQFPYQAGVTPILWVPATAQTPYEIGDGVNGMYVAYGSDIKNSQYFKVVGTDWEGYLQPPNTCTLSGWTYGTYNDGTHGCAKLVLGNLIEATAYATDFDDTQAAGAYFTDFGVGTTFSHFIQNGGFTFHATKSIPYDLSDHYVAGTLYGLKNFGGAYGTGSNPWKIVGSTGVASFAEAILRPLTTDGIVLYMANAAGTVGAYYDTNGNGTLYIPGQILTNSLVGKPSTNGQVFSLQNAAGNAFMICSSNATIGLSGCGVGAGADWQGFSDSAFGVQTYDLNAATGDGTFTGTITAANLAGPHNGTVGATTPSTVAATTVSASTSVLSTGSGGVGYATGAGGTVTQATSKSTGVTLNKVAGTITMNAAALAASTSVMFTLTDSAIAATDSVEVTIKSGATSLAYLVQVEATGAGSCNIVLRNVSAGSLSEAVVLTFAVLKAVAA